jgi:hypothetical protein
MNCHRRIQWNYLPLLPGKTPENQHNIDSRGQVRLSLVRVDVEQNKNIILCSRGY